MILQKGKDNTMFQTILFFVGLSVSGTTQDCQAIEKPGLAFKAPEWAFVVAGSQCVSRVGDSKAIDFLKNVETVVEPFED